MIQVTGYLIKREIGAGGMATVYLAEQSSLEREVALKVMNPQLATDPNFALRFLQEARTLASLAHPHIVAVYDVGTTESGLHYFSMQYLPNGDLSGRIKNQLAETELLPILTGVARALRYAHQRGIVHRDVSPVNVLFDLSGMPILTDFGIARAASRGSRLTSAGVSVGTSHYMSPEQARGGEVDARSDIYSLGATVHECLTGKPPFEGEDGFAIAYAHVFEAIPRLPEKFAHWQKLIDKSLAKDPRERYQNMDEYLAALAELGGTTANIPQPVLPDQTAVTQAAAAPEPGDAATIVGQVVPKTDPSTVVAKGAPSKPAPAPSPAQAPGAAPVKYVQKPPSRMVPLVLIGFGVVVLLAAGLAFWRQRANQPMQADASAVAAAGQVSSTKATASAEAPAPEAAPQAGTEAGTDAGTTGTTSAAPAPDSGESGTEPDSSVPALSEELPVVDPQAEAALLRLAQATTVVDPIKESLRLAASALTKQRYTAPGNPNAFDQYKLTLKLDAKNEKAKLGLVELARTLMGAGEKSLQGNKLEEALDFFKRGEEVARFLPEGQSVAQQIAQRRVALRDEALAAGRKAILAWDKLLATASFERALKLEPGNAEAQKGLKTAERVGEPGFVFRDPISASDGPELVVMTVAGRKLAVGRTEVTVGDFRRYWNARGSKARATRPSCRDRESFFRTSKTRTFQNPFDKPELAQDGEHPVVCVSWEDAADYVKWLSTESGKRYRLPSAAEFGALAQGARPAACKANLADQRYDKVLAEREGASCDDGYAGTAKVKSYETDSGPLYDVAGNVREWVSDCGGSCKQHLALGAAWLTVPGKAEGLPKESFDTDLGLTTVGFRVVREVE